MKILRWDTDGFLLYHKRLERGSFEMPRRNADTGYYWSSSAFDEDYAYDVYFDSSGVSPNSGDTRSSGYSVRLITEVK